MEYTDATSVPTIRATRLASALIPGGCHLQAWLSARRVMPPASPGPNLATWAMQHDAALHLTVATLRGRGYLVTTETENSFRITTRGVVVTGRPDIVAQHEAHVLVADVKTGAARPEHVQQLLLYMAILPHVRNVGDRPVNGVLYYPNDEVCLPAIAVTPEFRNQVRRVLQTLTAPARPRPSPGFPCRFCAVPAELCSERQDDIQPVVVPDVF